MTTCALSALRAATTFPAHLRHDGGLTDLAGECASTLGSTLAEPPVQQQTLCTGRPYTLVLTKTTQLFRA